MSMSSLFLDRVLDWTPRRGHRGSATDAAGPSLHSVRPLRPQAVAFVCDPNALSPPERDDLYDPEMDEQDALWVQERQEGRRKKSALRQQLDAAASAGGSGCSTACESKKRSREHQEGAFCASNGAPTTRTAEGGAAQVGGEEHEKPTWKSILKNGKNCPPNDNTKARAGASRRLENRVAFDTDSSSDASGDSEDEEYPGDRVRDVWFEDEERCDDGERAPPRKLSPATGEIKKQLSSRAEDLQVPSTRAGGGERPPRGGEGSSSDVDMHDVDDGTRTTVSCPACFAMLAEDAKEQNSWWCVTGRRTDGSHNLEGRLFVIHDKRQEDATLGGELTCNMTKGGRGKVTKNASTLQRAEMQCACSECGTPVGYVSTRVLGDGSTEARYRLVRVLVDSSWNEDDMSD